VSNILTLKDMASLHAVKGKRSKSKPAAAPLLGNNLNLSKLKSSPSGKGGPDSKRTAQKTREAMEKMGAVLAPDTKVNEEDENLIQ